LVADNPLDIARDCLLDRYQFAGEEREAAIHDLGRFAEVMIRIASRIAREKAALDSPE
jgi:hypothetical protein